MAKVKARVKVKVNEGDEKDKDKGDEEDKDKGDVYLLRSPPLELLLLRRLFFSGDLLRL